MVFSVGTVAPTNQTRMRDTGQDLVQHLQFIVHKAELFKIIFVKLEQSALKINYFKLYIEKS